MRLIIALVCLAGAVFSFGLGPWSAGAGGGYAQLVFTTIPTYDQIYAGGGDTRDAERELSDNTLALYTEFGVTEKLTVLGNLPLVMVSSGDEAQGQVATIPDGSLNRLGNVSLAAKYTLLQKGLVVAAIAQVDLPSATQEEATGLSTGVDATTIQPKLSVGSSGDNWFAYGLLGYGFRNNDFHDVFTIGIEGGFKATDNIYLIVNFTSYNSTDNGDASVDDPNNIATGLYTSFQEWNAVNVKIFAEKIVDNFGALASIGGGTGDSVAASPAISLGIFYKW